MNPTLILLFLGIASIALLVILALAFAYLPRYRRAAQCSVIIGLAILVGIVDRRLTSVYLVGWFGIDHLFMDPIGVGGSLGLIIFGVYGILQFPKELQRIDSRFTVESEAPNHVLHIEEGSKKPLP